MDWLEKISQSAFFDELNKIAACGSSHMKKKVKKKAALTKIAMPPIASGIGIASKIGRRSSIHKYLKGALKNPMVIKPSEPIKALTGTVASYSPKTGFRLRPKYVSEVGPRSTSLLTPA